MRLSLEENFFFIHVWSLTVCLTLWQCFGRPFSSVSPSRNDQDGSVGGRCLCQFHILAEAW